MKKVIAQGIWQENLKNCLISVKRIPRILLKALVRFYQLFLSPFKNYLLGGQAHCRFYPSCSDYAMECLKKHHIGWSCYLIIKRILKCHPWHPGGIDEVPRVKL